jgi:alkylation response protein AidB-like acyl-CoA dehydrogenase
MTVADQVIRTYGTPESQAYVEHAREIAPSLREHSKAIEDGRKLLPEIVKQFLDAGFFHALLPRDLGGREVDPVNHARVVEEIARGDASAGWCIMIANQDVGFAGFLPPDQARAIWGPNDICCGTARPIGRAVAVEGGFDVSGRWPFASGSSHATWFAGESKIYDGEELRRDAEGNERTKMLFIPASEITVHDTWDTLGLRGTASNDFSCEHAFVPETRGFQVLVDPPQHDWALYRAEPLAFINHGSHAIGVARGAIDAAVETAKSKVGWGGVMISDTPRLQGALAEAAGMVGAAATYLYESAWALWEQALASETDKPTRARVRLATSNAMRASLEAVDLLHATLATSAIQASNPLSRSLRDIHTASAHVMIGTMTFEASGRALMGMDPRFPFF